MDYSINSRTALLCPEHLYKDYAPDLFDLSLRILSDPLLDAIKEAGNSFEAHVLEKIRAAEPYLFEIDRKLPELAIQQKTSEALLNPAVPLIYGASLGNFTVGTLADLGHTGKSEHGRVSKPDLLVNIGKDEKGVIQWRPVDIKSHKSFTEIKSSYVYLSQFPSFNPEKTTQTQGRLVRKDGLQLAHYLRHLQELGFASTTPWAGILGKDMSTIAWADLNALDYGVGKATQGVFEIYEEEIKFKRPIIEQAIAQQNYEQERDNRINVPIRISGDFGCASCQYRKVCYQEMKNYRDGAGHVTLLSDITGPKAAAKLDGVDTVTELARSGDRFPDQPKAVIRARTWISGKEQLLNSNEPLRLPEFDIEIDIDLENSQAILQESDIDEELERDAVYLYGYGIHHRFANPDWRSAEFGYFDDYSNNEDAEFYVLDSMWKFMEEQVKLAIAAGKSIGFFHYSHHEKTWWRNYAKRHTVRPGVPTLEHIENFIESYFVDLLEYTKRVAFPVTGYSIKTLAPHAGFTWSADDAGGGNSIVYFKRASSAQTNKAQAEEAIDWLRRYNCEDVKATMAVREYLRKIAKEL